MGLYLGNPTIAGASGASGSGFMYGSVWVAEMTGVPVAINGYNSGGASLPQSFQMGIYTSTGTFTGNHICHTGTISITTLSAAAWTRATIATRTTQPQLIVAGQSYWVCYQSGTTSSAANQFRETTGGTGWWTGSQTMGTWPSSVPGSGMNLDTTYWSMYVELAPIDQAGSVRAMQATTRQAVF